MKQTLDFSDFCNAFERYNRADNFTTAAKRIIFDYFEEVDENYELDVIAICCEFNEANAGDVINDYGLDYSEDATEEELNEIAREYLSENTCIIGETSSTFIYAVF